MTFSNSFLYVNCTLLNIAGKEAKGVKGSGQTTMLSGVAIMGSWPFSALSVIPTWVQPLEILYHQQRGVCTKLPSVLDFKENLSESGLEFALPQMPHSPSQIMEAKQLLRWVSRLAVPYALLQTSGFCSATWQHKPFIILHLYVFPKSRPCHRKAEHCLTQSLAFSPCLNSAEPWTWAGGNRAALSLEMAPSCSSGLVWSPVKLLRLLCLPHTHFAFIVSVGCSPPSSSCSPSEPP